MRIDELSKNTAFVITAIAAMAASQAAAAAAAAADGRALARESACLVCHRASSFTGVLLRDILEKASITFGSHFDLKKTVVVATATDGYRVVFSINPLWFDPRTKPDTDRNDFVFDAHYRRSPVTTYSTVTDFARLRG